MSAVADVEELALNLSASERGKLISRLIESLGSPFEDEDEDAWIEEAVRRDKEMDENPDSVLTHEEFMAGLAEFRR
jgi:putative addiction module component, TIGR02574 family